MRIAARLPIWLYRLKLGWLFGDRFLMLTHIGRKTGQLRQGVLEVVRHDRATDTYIIASGWGERADWFRNIQHNPHVLLSAGARRVEAEAKQLAPALAAAELRDYAQQHPYAIRALANMMTGQAFDGSAAAIEQLAKRVPLIALRPRH
jgi:deazaflavin-dependent oxidoreductase (nitroreductase family)